MAKKSKKKKKKSKKAAVAAAAAPVVRPAEAKAVAPAPAAAEEAKDDEWETVSGAPQAPPASAPKATTAPSSTTPTDSAEAPVEVTATIAAIAKALRSGESLEPVSTARDVVEKMLAYFSSEGKDADALINAWETVLSQMLSRTPPLDAAAGGMCAFLRAVAPNVALLRRANAWNLGQVVSACVEPLELLIADDVSGADALISDSARAAQLSVSGTSYNAATLEKMIRTPGADGIGRAFEIRDTQYDAAHEDHLRCLKLDGIVRNSSAAAQGSFVASARRTNTLIALMLKSSQAAERRNPAARSVAAVAKREFDRVESEFSAGQAKALLKRESLRAEEAAINARRAELLRQIVEVDASAKRVASQIEDAESMAAAQSRRHSSQLASLRTNHAESFAALQSLESFNEIAKAAKASLEHVGERRKAFLRAQSAKVSVPRISFRCLVPLSRSAVSRCCLAQLLVLCPLRPAALAPSPSAPLTPAPPSHSRPPSSRLLRHAASSTSCATFRRRESASRFSARASRRLTIRCAAWTMM